MALSAFLGPAACGTPVVEINDVQGRGGSSPFEGRNVRIESVVVTASGPRGFFVQTPADRMDDDPRTSEGLYVFTNRGDGRRPGTRVGLTGRVVEFHGHTQLADAVVEERAGDGKMPAPITLDGRAGLDGLERFESMRVAVEGGVISGPTDRYGVAALSLDGRRPVMDAPAADRGVVALDPAGLGGAPRSLAAGTDVSVRGVMAYRFGRYTIWPSRLDAGPAPTLPRGVRAASSDELTVASFNLGRFVDDVSVAGEQAVDQAAYAARTRRAGHWLERVLACPDLVAVQEVEAHEVLSDLARSNDCGYRAEARLSGSRGVMLGFLVGPAVRPSGSARRLGRELTFGGAPLFSRPPLALRVATEAGPLDVINLHLRSMRGLDAEPRVAAKRAAQARALAEILSRMTENQPRLLAVGDFNALPFDDGRADVMGTLLSDNAGLVNALDSLPRNERYSFVYEGIAQSLDYALYSRGMAEWFVAAAFARGNADAPVDAGGMMRLSDHDPLVVYLRPR